MISRDMPSRIRRISDTEFEIDGVKRKFSPPTQRVKRFDSDTAKAEVHRVTKDFLERTILDVNDPRNVTVLHLPGENAQDTKVVYLASGLDPKNLIGIECDERIKKNIEALGLGIPLIYNYVETYVADSVARKDLLNYDVVSLDFSGPISSNLVHTIRDLVSILGKDHVLFHTANLLWREKGYRGYSVGYALHKRISDPSSSTLTDPHSLIAVLRDIEYDYRDKYDMDSKTRYYPYVILNALTTRAVEEYPAAARFAYGRRFDRAEQMFIGKVNEALGERHESLDLVQLVKSHNGRNTGFFAEFHRRVAFMLGNQLLSEGISGVSAPLVLSALLETVSSGPRLWSENLFNYRYIAEEGGPMIGSFFLLKRSNAFQDAAVELAHSMGFPSELKIRDKKKFMDAYRIYSEHLTVMMRTYASIKPITEIASAPKPPLTQQNYNAAKRAGMTDDQISQAFRGGTVSQIARFASRSHTEIPVEEEVIVIDREGVINLIASGMPPEDIYKNYITNPQLSLGSIRAISAHVTRGTYGNKDDLARERRGGDSETE